MLESASGSNEGPPSFSCKTDGVQSTFHAAIRAARSAPDRVACPQPSFRGSIIQRIGIQPERFGSQSQSFSRMRNGLLRRQMILVLWIVVGNDADAKCAPHTQSVHSSMEKPHQENSAGITSRVKRLSDWAQRSRGIPGTENRQMKWSAPNSV